MKTYITIMVLSVLFTATIYADSKHHYSHETIAIQPEVRGIASAISAAQCSFDSSTFDLQLCGAVGYTDNQEAVTFGIGKKYKDFLINGTISSEDNHTSFGAAINWKVK